MTTSSTNAKPGRSLVTPGATPLKAGQVLEVVIEALDDEACGIATVGGMRLQVPFAAPGDVVRVAVEAVSRHRPQAVGRCLEVRRSGDARQAVDCTRSIQGGGRCGGCPALHLRDEVALEMKRQAVVQALAAEGLAASVSIAPAPLARGYRNRATFVAQVSRNGTRYLGGYAPRSHRVVRMTGCPVLLAPLPAVCEALEALMNRLEMPVHPEPLGLRYVLLRANAAGDVLVEGIWRGCDEPMLRAFAQEAMHIPGVAGVWASENASTGNAVRVSQARHLVGARHVTHRFGRVDLRLNAGVFAQLNADVASQMYVAAAAELGGASQIWDLYCGTGGLALNALARHPDAAVLGVDSVAESVALARAAARHQGFLQRARFEVLDLRDAVPDGPMPDAVVVNPPRRGLDAAVCDALASDDMGATTLLYMSCGPKGFARDAARLVSAGWRLEDVRAWDMLPGTAHVELLARFTRSRPR